MTAGAVAVLLLVTAAVFAAAVLLLLDLIFFGTSFKLAEAEFLPRPNTDHKTNKRQQRAVQHPRSTIPRGVPSCTPGVAVLLLLSLPVGAFAAVLLRLLLLLCCCAARFRDSLFELAEY